MPEDRKDRREKMAKEAKTNAMRMLDRQKRVLFMFRPPHQTAREKGRKPTWQN